LKVFHRSQIGHTGKNGSSIHAGYKCNSCSLVMSRSRVRLSFPASINSTVLRGQWDFNIRRERRRSEAIAQLGKGKEERRNGKWEVRRWETGKRFSHPSLDSHLPSLISSRFSPPISRLSLPASHFQNVRLLRRKLLAMTNC